MSFWNKIENPNADSLPRPPSTPAAEPTPPRSEPARAEPARAEPLPPPPARAEAPAASPSSIRQDSLRLGHGVRLEGKLTFSGTVRIDATFKGSIVTDGVLVVGEHAKVDADITCGTVIVEGEVNGNLSAKEAVELGRTARLRGDIEAPTLAIERGAAFEGTSRRPKGSASPRAGKAAAAPASS